MNQNSKLGLCLPAHIAILALFFGLTLATFPTVESLSGLHVGFAVQETVPAAFARLLIFLPLALLISLGRTHLDRRIASASEPNFNVISALMAVLIFYTALRGVLQFPICGDDSFIDFRYVKNWVEGISFDYNPGERVLGFTSYIHVALLAVLSRLFADLDLPVLAQLTNVFFAMTNLALIYFFILDLYKSRLAGLLAASVYAFDPFTTQQMIFGKEAHILITLLVLSLWAIFRERPRSLAWLACLIPFVRPEGAVYSLVCFIWSLKSNGKKALLIWLPPVATATLFLAGVLLYFGTIVPHGMIAKLAMFYPSSYPKVFFMALWMMGTGTIIPRYYVATPGLYYGLGCSIFGMLIFGAFAVYAFKARLKVIPLYLITLFLYLAIFAYKNPEAFSWYLAWFALFPVFLVATLVSSAERLKPRGIKLVACGLALAAFLGSQVSQQVIRPVPALSAIAFDWSPEFDRMIKFDQALAALNHEQGGERALLATPEIGYIGFHHPGPILDLAGLLSPRVIKYGHPPLSQRTDNKALEINPAIVADLKPPYIVSLEVFCRLLMQEDFFKKEYRVLEFFPNKWAGSQGIYLFKRN
ncbi:MAG: hypothetical protein KC777_00370 [Cyanobacteria bacterium HKST-UBA02]|nr:hypothetical protein [Cyanobacteria bacterium HKST-UBA02]